MPLSTLESASGVEDREDVITQTSERVATDTTAKVTGTLKKQYGSFISNLYKEIAALEAEMHTQASLRKEEIQLNYTPAVDVAYAGGQIQLWNRGRTSISLRGDKYDDTPADIELKPAVVGPTDYYYILTDRLRALISASLGKNGEARVPIEFYLSTEDNHRYTVSFR